MKNPRRVRSASSVSSVVCVVAFALGAMMTGTARAQGSTRRITIDAGALRCVLEQTAHGVALSRLIDRRSHTQLASDHPAPLFEAAMNNASQKQQGMRGGDKLMLRADQGWRQVRVTRTPDGGARIQWSAPAQAPLQGVRVTAVAAPDAKANALRWTLSVHNDSKRWSVWEVVFPQLSVADLGKDAQFFYPRFSGTVIPLPRKGEYNWHHSLPGGSGCTLPYFAVYVPSKTGLYVGREDPEPAIKILSAHKDKGRSALNLSFDEPAANLMTAGNDFTLSGEGVWQLFDGDWYDAATIYRRWVRAHAPWYPKVGPQGREDIPLWMRKLAVWVRFRTKTNADIEQRVQKAEQFARFMGVPVGLHWYVWWRGEFDNDYPNYFPPKQGFARGVKELQSHNLYVMPYINARLWDTHDQGMKDKHFTREARPYAEKDADGKIYRERYHSHEDNGQYVKFAVMCPATDFWQNKVREIALRLFKQYQVKGVYLDQLGGTAFAKPIDSKFHNGRVVLHRKVGGPLSLCMDPDHDHTVGGGDWQPNGYKEMLRKIRARMPDDRILCGEHSPGWLSAWFAGALVPAWRGEDLVPAFPAIYGGGALQIFGRAFHRGGDAAGTTRVLAGLELVYGQQLGWWSPGVIDHKPLAKYLRQLVRLRYHNAPYFYAGQMARPLHLDMPDYTTQRRKRGRKTPVTRAAVLTGSWEQPRKHKLLLLFVNTTEKPVTTTLKVDLSRYGFTGGQVRLRTVQPDKQDAPWSSAPTRLRRKMTFPAASAMALEVAPALRHEPRP